MKTPRLFFFLHAAALLSCSCITAAITATTATTATATTATATATAAATEHESRHVLLTALQGAHGHADLAQHLLPATQHEHKLHNHGYNNDHDSSSASTSSIPSSNSAPFVLLCSAYELFPRLQAAVPVSFEAHPVLHSLAKDQSCAMMSGEASAATRLILDREGVSVTESVIPHMFKYHESIEESLENPDADSITLEVSVGLGISGKGFASDNAHVLVDALYKEAAGLLMDEKLATAHWDRFYWTSDVALDSIHSDAQSAHLSRDAKFRDSADTISVSCDFPSLMTVSISQSYISFTTGTKQSGYNAACVRLLATVATLHPSVSHVSAHLGVQMATPQKEQSLTSIDYTDPEAGPATDQNAWVQSGTTDQTPYSALGVDGTGYVLGMIDTGVDDLSCFMIDSTGNITTRTPASDYLNPITEPFRRKVIQYIMWGDGEPSREYDHGTWCAGASLGNCINDTSAANAYNGIAYNAKITMFDVDISSTENYLNVPSLHNVALPPAYAAGARVHSNSWTTYYMSSYTSKSLDVDEFMYEHSDFLFIAGAGNSGSEGFNSVTSPAVSKSALTVGASSVDHNDVVGFSSLGSAYDSAFKPNIVTPGRYLMSAGVRNENETNSCNVQDSSGTSMATPIAAGAALLIRQYMENSSFYGSFCNQNYRSCPIVVVSPNPYQSNFISGALLKAMITHSAQNMNKYESCDDCAIPETNFSTPPDNIQGWGQVQLNHVLPIPGTYDFDLYVADYELLSSLTRMTYFVQVSSASKPLRATIAWTDPPNILWAVKNLLNDLDIMVISPSGVVVHGNNIPGDEFNTVERVVIDTPEVGEYIVYVTAKVLVVHSQAYGIVITCDGSVDEARTSSAAISIDDVIQSAEEDACPSSTQLIRFQLEDWDAGEAWTNMSLAIYADGSAVADYSCTFPDNLENSLAVFNRMHQCSTCLPTDSSYTASVVRQGDGDMPIVTRAVSPQCNVYLSNYQQEAELVLTGEDGCNSCPSGSSLVQVAMYANVTDDDESQYSWYGLAAYHITSEDGTTAVAGTLVVSNEQADRYCLKEGNYALSLNDTLLFDQHRKNALLVVTPSSTGVNVTLFGTSEVTLFVVADDSIPSGNGDDDDSPSTILVVLVSVGAGLILIGLFIFIWYYNATPCCFSDSEDDIEKPLVV